MRALPLLLLLACGPPPDHLVGDGPCRDPQVWYPDEDGDGVGETTSVYFGCDPPNGWRTNTEATVTTPPTEGGTGGSGT